MLTLLILRHAKSSWNDPTQKDHDRPLNERGERATIAIGNLIHQEKLTPDLIISSTAKRAQMTAQKVAQNCHYTHTIHYSAQFYPGTTTDYINGLNQVSPKNKNVMIIGHNPGLEEFLAHLIKDHKHLHAGSLAKLELPIETWKDFNTKTRANLIHLWHPQGS